jgi:hypothetical protein
MGVQYMLRSTKELQRCVSETLQRSCLRSMGWESKEFMKKYLDRSVEFSRRAQLFYRRITLCGRESSMIMTHRSLCVWLDL